MIISIDPGLHACGLAIFHEKTKQLVHAELVKNVTSKDLAELIFHMGWRVQNALEDTGLEGLGHIYVIELPQVYRGSLQKGDPNDLVALGAVVGSILALCETDRPRVLYKPREWKGQVPKDIMVKRIISKLSDDEKARAVLPRAKSLSHNVWDAVGIGLFYLKRL